MTDNELTPTDHYVRDLLHMLLERTRQAKVDRAALGAGNQDPFEAGRHTAYYEMVSAALGNLRSFGLSRTRFDVAEDFSPDRDLL